MRQATVEQEFKQTEIGEIPADWDIKQIKEFFTVNYGKSRPKTTGNVPLVGSSGVFGHVGESLINFQTIIIGRKGTAGKAWLTKTPSYPSDTTFYLSPHSDNGELRLDFLYYHLNFQSFTSSNDVIPSLHKHEVEDYAFSCPDITEQEKIAFVLSEIQKAVETQEKIIANLKELKATTTAKLFREGTRGEPLKQTEIGEMPERWQIRKLGTLATFQGGFAFKSMDYQKDGIRLFKISNVSFGKVLWDDVSFLPIEYLKQHKEYFLNRGDIVLAMTRPVVTGGIKVARLLEVDMPCLLNQRVGRFILGDKIRSDFLYHFLFTKTFTKHIVSGAEGAQQPNISANKIEQALVPYPPDAEEQQEIADILSTIDSKIVLQVDKYANLSELFQSSLNLLMNGKKRVKDLNIAEALANAR